MPLPTDTLPPENRILAALPAADYQHLSPHLERVTLPHYQVLYQPNEPIQWVYFPHQAVVSLVNLLADGSTVETGLVGHNGVVGLPAVLSDTTHAHQAIVQVAGDATRISAEMIRTEFSRGGQLQCLLLRYMQALFTMTAQTAACNRFHTIEERLARWLLLVQNSIQSDQFSLTQEFIAQMLGSRRSGVTVAAGALQQAGMIRYSRGKITILNQDALMATACECYEVIKHEYAKVLGES